MARVKLARRISEPSRSNLQTQQDLGPQVRPNSNIILLIIQWGLPLFRKKT